MENHQYVLCRYECGNIFLTEVIDKHKSKMVFCYPLKKLQTFNHELQIILRIESNLTDSMKEVEDNRESLL